MAWHEYPDALLIVWSAYKVCVTEMQSQNHMIVHKFSQSSAQLQVLNVDSCQPLGSDSDSGLGLHQRIKHRGMQSSQGLSLARTAALAVSMYHTTIYLCMVGLLAP
eukprot:122329-Chlamydomonas_euryale.AAC.1